MTNRPTLFLDATRYVLMKNGVPHTRVMTIDEDKRCQSITDVPWTLLWDGGNESIWRQPLLPVNQRDENGLPVVNSGTESGKPSGKPEGAT